MPCSRAFLRLSGSMLVALAVLLVVTAPGGAQTPGPPVQHIGASEGNCLECHTLSGPLSGESTASAFHNSLVCTDCHDPHGYGANLVLVPDSLDTPNSGMRRVIFTSRTGPNSFADGDVTYDGICEVCHTATLYHRNDASGSHSHFPGQDCTSCHPHYGFQPTGADCLDCHDRSQPFQAGDYRRQVVGAGGDFDRPSHHVTDGSALELVQVSDCEVCHDQSSHQQYADGVSVLLRDPAGGPSILYDGSPESLEPFCLGCHDGSHPAPFSGGLPASDIATRWAGSAHPTNGATCFECHGNAHGSDHAALLVDNYSFDDYTVYDPTAYALCWRCHDASTIVFDTNRFDDLHQKHVSGEEAPCIICHDTHGPTDAEEPGLIDFEYGLTSGMDIQMLDGRDASTAFGVQGEVGSCYLTCHAEDHQPEDYARDNGGSSLAVPGHPDGSGSRLRVGAYPTPGSGPVTIHATSTDPSAAGTIRVTIHDIAGRRIDTLNAVMTPGGEAQVRWSGRLRDGRAVEAGIYFLRVEGAGEVRVVKIIRLD